MGVFRSVEFVLDGRVVIVGPFLHKDDREICLLDPQQRLVARFDALLSPERLQRHSVQDGAASAA